MVQITSINWFSRRKRLVSLLKNVVVRRYPTKTVIVIRIIIAWSWKKVNCSIRGEALFWRPRLFQNDISKENTYLRILNPISFLTTIDSKSLHLKILNFISFLDYSRSVKLRVAHRIYGLLGEIYGTTRLKI